MATRSRPPSRARSLSIRDSWNPFFRQPPLSSAKYLSSGSSAFSGTPVPVEETPRAAPKAKPIGKAQPFLGAPAPIIPTGAPRRDPLSLFNPYPSSSFPSGPAPAPQGPPPAPVVTTAQPPAVIDTLDTREFIPIFSDLNEDKRTTFFDHFPLFPPLHPVLLLTRPCGHPLTLAAPTPLLLWQPVPGHPLEPSPLSIRETWDPNFRQPPLSNLGKSPSSGLPPPPWPPQPVENLEQKLKEVKETGIKTRTNVENISQTVDVWALLLARATKRASQLRPTSSQRALPPRVPSPPPSPRLRSPIGASAPLPPAPVATYPAPVKVDHPDAYTGKIGVKPSNGSPECWHGPGSMRDSAGAWAHPHLDQLGSHRAIIQTGRRAEDHHTHPVRHMRDYITKFRTLAMELDWNDAALRGQFARGLHWEVSRQIATREHRPRTLLELQNAALVIDNALREERASHPPRDNKSSKPSNPARGRVPINQLPFKETLHDPNFVSEEERNCRRAAGACIKCGKMGHKFAECRTGWKATPIEDKGKAKETAKIGEDSEYQSGKEPPYTPHRYYARWVEPQAGKIWKKAVLTFSFDGKQMTETFLICNTGSHAAILGLKWLDSHNPEIDWNLRTLSFPHTPPEQVSIAKEEEADKDPLEGVPPSTISMLKYLGKKNSTSFLHTGITTLGLNLRKKDPSTPLYSMTDAESATLKDWLRDKLKAGKIRPSKSSISSPVMFVPKKDGSRRLVVDYRRLNNRTKKNVYPLPRPNNLMAQLRGAKVFTKLDLQWGYNNVRVKEGDEWKTAFRTKYGLYESLVMTFGLTNAPAAFQHFMNDLFKDLLMMTHCTLGTSRSPATPNGKPAIFLDKLKIQAIQEWPTPTKVKEVQSFLGFANFLRRFVANFSHMARPLHNLVKKDAPWKWDTREQEAFQGLKDAITNAPVLCHADPAKPYFLKTDASGAALGSILSQRQEDGRLHPLGFLSESFKGAEQNYDTHNKELLAIIRSFEYWRIFLKEPCTLSPFRKPDALSRRSDHADIPPDAQTMLPDPVFANVALVTPEKELQRRSSYLRSRRVPGGNPPIPAERTSDVEDRLTPYIPRQPLSRPPRQTTDLRIGIQKLLLPGIRADTYWHVDSCETCQRIRKPKYAPIPPQPLELPVRPWQHVSYDMIVDLPKDGSNNSILVIVDSFTKYGIFVKCSKKLKAPELAELFLEHVWKRHGMPEKTVSDRGRVFNNKFLRALYKRLGIDPHFSSAYHPQSDGQTERVNPSIEHFLRAYSGVNQRDWTKWLPMAEFAYNNAVHSSTGKTPFKALYGWEPTLTPSNVPTDVPEANNLAQTMEAQWKEVESALRQSKQRMTAGEDGSPMEFEIGEEAWLDAKKRPFKVIEKISDRAYRLELPPTMRVHDVFYVGLLHSGWEEEYEVEGITDAEERNGKWFFRVKWKGYGSEEKHMGTSENLKNAEKILKKYEEDMKKKALGAAKALRGGQCHRHT
ncbi:hypothetical protein RHS01_05227 [Rhizoctonia solani]|uniref:Uncharacterized protein n=1 Tax=Rhizoctonia solani TaxID=456999 RepID=A0A8H7IF91_9AGAM|nr:hypothetical protein RHS01_05227 [Rhizoctonia solani]